MGGQAKRASRELRRSERRAHMDSRGRGRRGKRVAVKRLEEMDREINEVKSRVARLYEELLDLRRKVEELYRHSRIPYV